MPYNKGRYAGVSIALHEVSPANLAGNLLGRHNSSLLFGQESLQERCWANRVGHTTVGSKKQRPPPHRIASWQKRQHVDRTPLA